MGFVSGGLRALGRLLVAIFSVVVLAFAAVGVLKVFPGILPSLSRGESVDSQIMNSVTREQQVVLLSLGIQGISETDDRSEFFGLEVPGTGRSSFLEYSFNAKLGIQGEDVRIERTGEKSYLISIPEFTFIGYDSPDYKIAAKTNGVLSWMTPEIDTAEMITRILSDSARKTYIESNEDTLKDQAKIFYSNIISGIDPTIVTEFDFA
ncbi:hypothetical protein [Actinomyces sp.]|uniref:hypothetical protein n=1 Tax=Actinomyces sp. TaxID=29317 RepID=UPI00289CCF5D|nr:hypothetical protein [Actinomyces sp.]